MKQKKKEYPKEVLDVIPDGYYCHGQYVTYANSNSETINDCPFWFKIKKRAKHENGYCVLLGKGDYELNREPNIGIWRSVDKGKVIKKWKAKYGPNNPSSSSLLWDQCKECGIKMKEHNKLT